MLLGMLLEQGAQRLGHVGQLEHVGLGEALTVALELVALRAGGRPGGRRGCPKPAPPEGR